MRGKCKSVVLILLSILILSSQFLTIYADSGIQYETINDIPFFQESQDNYASWKRQLKPDNSRMLASVQSSKYTISNEFLEATVDNTDEEGKFTIGTTGGDPDIETDNYVVLLYGHPTPWSSITTINIDGEYYIFRATSFTQTENEIIAEMTIGDILIQQVIALVNNETTNREDLIKISYNIINKGDSEANVGVRIMLDTMLGRNDGAPFRLPGLGAVTTEKEFVGANVPQFWQAFDDLDNPSVISNGTVYKSIQEKPDKIQFAYWADIYYTLWDYTIDPDKPVTSDSAVAIYYNPERVNPGSSINVSTYYGIGRLSSDSGDDVLSLSVAAPQKLELDSAGTNYSPNPFTITAYLYNQGSESKKPGAAIITAIAEDGGKLARCTVTVLERDTVLRNDYDINFRTVVSGPTLHFLGKDFELFNIPVGTEIKIADYIELKYDPDEQKYIGLFGDFEGVNSQDDLRFRQECYRSIRYLLNMMGQKTNREFYNAWLRLTKREGPFIVSGDISVFGYVAFVENNGKLQLAEGELGVLSSVKTYMSHPTAIPAIFFKYKITGDTQAGIKLVLKETGILMQD